MNEVLKKLSQQILNSNQIAKILGNPQEYPCELIEELSKETAIRYWNGEIDFHAGDCIMNNLYSFWVTNDYFIRNFKFGEISTLCFEAFDCGEYFRPNDSKDVDPPEKYTKPLINKLLKELKKISTR